jgi:nicotinate-nucleotide pyrophosphorylase (carboxylating)
MDEIEFYLNEDLKGKGDITSDSLFTTKQEASAYIIAGEQCIVAGLEEGKTVFLKTGATVALKFFDGDLVKKGAIVAVVSGPARAILKGERLALNIISRLSGIASETKKLVDLVHTINPYVSVAATRKTTPGFRRFEKKAVVIGGGEAHRQGLFDVVMIKDNHLKLVDSMKKAIDDIRLQHPDVEIEIEVETIAEAVKAAVLAVDVIMLDNFSAKDASIAYKKIKSINPNILVEVSGGITPSTIADYVRCADRISLGYLTTSIKNKDFSLEIQ